MKRSPLLRRTPLKSKRPVSQPAAYPATITVTSWARPKTKPKRLPAKRATPRRSERVADRAYLDAVHRLPCWAYLTIEEHICAGPIEADHAGARPLGRKADDSTCIPLCQLAHRQRTDWTGPWKKWDKAAMRRWLLRGQTWAWTALRYVPGKAIK